MVNQDIVNYLKEGKRRGFSIQLLKQKLLEGGFEETDINDAITELNKLEVMQQVSQPSATQKTIFQTSASPVSQTSTASPPSSTSSSTSSTYFPQQPIKSSTQKSPISTWLKISGVLGIALLVFSVIFFYVVFSLKNSLVLMVYFMIIAIFSMLYVFGFYKLGKQTDSKLLKFSSLLMIILLAVFLMLFIIASSTDNEILKSLESLSAGTAKGMSIFLVIATMAITILFIISRFLFSLGLLKVRDKVKMAKVSGLVNLVVSIFAAISFVLSIILIFTASEVISTFSAGSFDALGEALVNAAAIGIMFLISGTVYIALKFISIIIEIILLFKASKQL